MIPGVKRFMVHFKLMNYKFIDDFQMYSIVVLVLYHEFCATEKAVEFDENDGYQWNWNCTKENSHRIIDGSTGTIPTPTSI